MTSSHHHFDAHKVIGINAITNINNTNWTLNRTGRSPVGPFTITESNNQFTFTIPTYKGGIAVTINRNGNTSTYSGKYKLAANSGDILRQETGNVTFTLSMDGQELKGVPKGFANNEKWILKRQP